MSVGITLQEAADLIRRNVFALVVICAIVFVPADLLVALVYDDGGTSDPSLGRILLSNLVALLAAVFALAAAIAAVSVEPEGAEENPSTPLHALRDAAGRLGTIVALTVVAIVSVAAGLVLLVIPGLVLLTWWFVAYQAAMVESRGWRESLGRSRELVRGHFWAVLALAVLVVVVVGVVDYVVLRVALEALPDRLGIWLGGVVGHTIGTIAEVAVTTAAYWQLNERSTLQES